MYQDFTGGSSSVEHWATELRSLKATSCTQVEPGLDGKVSTKTRELPEHMKFYGMIGMVKLFQDVSSFEWRYDQFHG